MSKYGPFDRYTEVDTADGTFGVHPGEVLIVDGKGVRREPVAPDPEPDPDAVPDGNVADVLDWVGDDVDRAVRAHDAESEARHPRVTLIAALEDLIGGDDGEEEAPDDEASESDSEEAQDDHPSGS